MKPFDPRLLTEVKAARGPVAALGALSCLDGVVSIAAAIAGAQLVWAVVSSAPQLSTTITWFIATLAAKALISTLTERQAAISAVRVAQQLRRLALQRWSNDSLDEIPDAEDRAARVTLGAASVEPYVSRYLPALVSAAVVPFLALATLLVVDWISALIVVLTLPLLPLFAALIGQHTRDETERKWQATARLSSHFSDVMRGLPTLANYQRAEMQASRIESVGERLRRSTIQTLKTAFLSSAALELLTTISVAIVAVFVGLRLSYGSMGLAAGLIAILVAPEAYWPIRRVGQEFHAAADGLQAIDRLVPVKSTPAQSSTAEGTRWVDRISYRYPRPDGHSGDLVLSELSLDEPTGLVVITGESGAGKSTLLDLLAGLRRPQQGSIHARQVALVSQRPVLVPGSVADNLAAGPRLDPVAAVAAHSPILAAELSSLLAGLPAADATVIGDDGVGLSAGQRQLLAICRAVVSGREVLLVDEPTAHLDRRHGEVLIRALDELSASRVVVAVSHDARLIEAAETLVELTRLASDEPAAELAAPESSDDSAATADDDRAAQLPLEKDGASERVRPRTLLPAIALGTMAQCCGVALTAASGWLIVKASTQPVILTLLTAVVSVRAFGIFRPVFRHWERLSSHDVALERLAKRRAAVYAALVPLAPAGLGRRRRGEVLAAAARDVDDEIDALPRGIVPLAAIATTASLALVGTFLVLPKAGLVLAVALAAIAVICLLIRMLEPQRHRRVLAARADLEAVARVSAELGPLAAPSVVSELLAGHEQALAGEQVRATARLVRVRAIAFGLTHLWVGLTTASLAVVVAEAVRRDQLPATVAAMVVLGPLALTQLLTGLPDAISALTKGRAARRRVAAVTEQPLPITSPDDPEPWQGDNASAELVEVSASWTGERPHLQNCSLRVDSATMVGITGANGAGKSTAMAVLAMQLAPTSGLVLHGERAANRCALDEVRRQLAIVDDEPHVFVGDLRANLMLAQPDASDAELLQALSRAGLSQWFAGLPDGFDTEFGVGGRGLSGGERARLGLARAIVSARPVMLLDEPVAHLDHPTATAVLTDLAAARTSRTVVLVSHQEVGLEHCDAVITLSATGDVAAEQQEQEPALCH